MSPAITLRSKLPGVGNTIFSVMSALARQHDAINLSQGFPDFDIPEYLTKRVDHYMAGGFNQYAPMPGAESLRQAIATKANTAYGCKLNPETDVTVTAGATQALYTAITATIREGDEVILFTPAYDSYTPAITLNGGVPIYIPLTFPEYRIPWDDVKKMVSQRTRMIIINSPHNPTGATLKQEDMQQLQRLVNGSDIVILSDEVYEHMVYDDMPHESVLRYPELAKRSFGVFSFGKTLHATGWKIGYCIAPPRLSEEFRKVHQFMVFSVNHPAQLAIADFITEQPEFYQELSDFYQQKRDLFLNGLEGSRFSFIPTEGTYFQLLNYSEISKAKDVELARRWTKEFGVASIPVSVFYHREMNNFVLRFCFAKADETLKKATEILCKI